jgi:hypothetical protein
METIRHNIARLAAATEDRGAGGYGGGEGYDARKRHSEMDTHGSAGAPNLGFI